MSIIYLKNVSKCFDNKEILKKIDLKIKENETLVLVGGSGSGKTTLLRLMNGLLQPTKGEVLIEGKRLTKKEFLKFRRAAGYCIQSGGLFPHMTVLENISIVARGNSWPKADIMKRSEELLERLDLSYHTIIKKKPHQLSGGQAQRVAIARSLFLDPKIIFMDESFGSLDPILRCEMQDWFLDIQKDFGLTAVMITHDLHEAFKMANRVALVNEGRIEQLDSPENFRAQPKTKYIKSFLKAYGYNV